jgi:energy-coupling factor transporter transmembrane protein EcfT
MDSLLLTDEDENSGTSKIIRQALSFLAHTALALGSWLALMLIGYAVNPQGVPQLVILLLSLAVPLIVGFIVTRIRQDDMATVVWLLGLIWLMIVALWIVDMPTRPNECFQCGVTEKLSRTLFSLPRPSGLIDDDGPFIGTWPAAALVGYSIGAALALRRKAQKS